MIQNCRIFDYDWLTTLPRWSTQQRFGIRVCWCQETTGVRLDSKSETVTVLAMWQTTVSDDWSGVEGGLSSYIRGMPARLSCCLTWVSAMWTSPTLTSNPMIISMGFSTLVWFVVQCLSNIVYLCIKLGPKRQFTSGSLTGILNRITLKVVWVQHGWCLFSADLVFWPSSTKERWPSNYAINYTIAAKSNRRTQLFHHFSCRRIIKFPKNAFNKR